MPFHDKASNFKSQGGNKLFFQKSLDFDFQMLYIKGMLSKIDQKEHEKHAKRLNIHPTYLDAILKGRQKPSIDLAIRIEKEYKGKVRAASLRPELRKYEKLLK
jgi:transcriptional regulator with XRE-family HTH domain